MTIRLAHLINPFLPAKGSEFEYVQPITFESMRVAKNQAENSSDIKIDLLTAQFPEDRPIIPDFFRATSNLDRSVRDVYSANNAPKYPLIGDLLGNLFEESDADYLIYTNVDIAVQPNFYEFIAEQLSAGLDACIINRRRIPDHYRKIEELPAMYAEQGKPHPGFDCFVFHRSLFPKFSLAKVCIGIPFIGIVMAQNIFCHAKNYQLYENEFLTFHIGEDVFKSRHKKLLRHNRKEFKKAILHIWPEMNTRNWPYGNRWLPVRLIKWGLHPSLPIRLAIKLEWKNWLSGYNKF